MKKNKICIIVLSNHPDTLKFSHYYLSTESFDVFRAENCKNGIELARKILPHLIIIDEILPDLDGFETIRQMREIPELIETKLLFLTDQSEDQRQITAYKSGADDFITRSITPKVLTSKIKALLRNYKKEVPTINIVKLGDLIINREEYSITIRKSKFDLPRKEFEIISLLATKPGKVLKREEIFREIWGKVMVRPGCIEVKIKNLRDKVGKEKIVTVKGQGYKIVP